MVASHNRGGTYLRRRAKPVIVTSTAAEAVKGAFATVSAAWKGLGDAAREAWTLWASNNPVTDRLGNKITLDGHAAFLKCNANQEAAGASLLDLPPVNGAPDGLSTLTVDGAIVSSALNIRFTPSQAATSQILMVRATVATSEARNYLEGKYKLAGFSGAAQVSQFNVLSLIESRLGTLQNGDFLHVRVATYDPATGLQSTPLTAKDVVSGHA
jgi:hypothetical protein